MPFFPRLFHGVIRWPALCIVENFLPLKSQGGVVVHDHSLLADPLYHAEEAMNAIIPLLDPHYHHLKGASFLDRLERRSLNVS